MSISILEEPQRFQPVYNEVVLVLDSTLKTEEAFQFIIDITVNGTYSSRMKVAPNPDGYGVVDMHRHLESYCSYNLDVSDTEIFQQMTDSFCKYSVALKEEYVFIGSGSVASNFGGNIQVSNSTPHGLSIGDKVIVSGSTVPAYDGITTVVSVISSTVVELDVTYTANAVLDYQRVDGATATIDSATVMSQDKFAVNAVEEWVDVPNFDYTDYVMSTSPLGNFLSTLPSSNETRLEDRFYSNVFNDTEMTISYLAIVSDNGIFRIPNAYSTPTDANKFLTVSLSPYLLNNTTDTVTVLSGSLPIVDANTTSYTAVLWDSTFNPVSETFTFNVDASCNNFEIYRMIYLDPYGSFLNVNFELPTFENTAVRRTNYKQSYGSYNGSSYGWQSMDRGVSRLDTEIKESYKISTGWLDNQVASQVRDLLLSPEVYHLDENGLLRAVEVKTSGLRTKTQARNKTFNYSLTFEYANNNTRQRG